MSKVQDAGTPDAPTGLTASNVQQTQFDLSWSAPSANGGGSLSYKVMCRDDLGEVLRLLLRGATNLSSDCIAHRLPVD